VNKSAAEVAGDSGMIGGEGVISSKVIVIRGTLKVVLGMASYVAENIPSSSLCRDRY
jgi:hypothetical protein